MTPLCEIAYKYGTDKCPQIGHSYTPFYYEEFKDKRMSVKKVFEMGIGCPDSMAKFYKEYKTGASLFMWRDFFPNAMIYGADIEEQTMVRGEDRIETFICDETRKDHIENLISIIGNDIDVFIDDGTHYVHEQEFLLKTAYPLLKKGVFYSIEDVCYPRQLLKRIKEFNCEVPTLLGSKNKYRDNLVIVRGKRETV